MTWQRPDMDEPCSYPVLSRRGSTEPFRMSQNGPCAQSVSQAGPMDVCSQKAPVILTLCALQARTHSSELAGGDHDTWPPPVMSGKAKSGLSCSLAPMP